MSPTTLDSILAISESMGLGASAVRTLCYLVKRPNETVLPTHISRHLGYSTSAATETTDKLVKLGFITREVIPEDRRKLLLKITEKGTAALDRILKRKPASSTDH